MRYHNFFIQEPVQGNKIFIEDSNLLNQWRNVLRFQKGDEIFILNDTEFKYRCLIEELKKDQAVLLVLEKQHLPEKVFFDLEIVQSLIKKDKLEWVLEKGTELGVKKFSPAVSDRSVKQKFNLQRAQKILREASEQSGRNRLPEVSEVKSLDNFLEERSMDRKYIALDPQGEKFSKKFLTNKKLGVFIGPEGGFSEREIEIFKEKNIPVYSLGEQILRSETAAVSFAALALLGTD